MNRQSTARVMLALVLHFFSHTFARPVAWLIFVAAPIAVMVLMHLLVGLPGVGILVFMSMLQACVTAGFSLKEKEEGTYHRILAAPVSPAVYTGSLFIAVYLVSAVQILLVLGVVAFLPGSEVNLGFGRSVLVLLVFAVSATGYGILLTGVTSTTTSNSVLTNVTVIVTSMVGGCFWPVWVMPGYMQQVARVLPQTWSMLAVEALLAGDSAGTVAANLGVLALFGVVFALLFALLRRRG